GRIQLQRMPQWHAQRLAHARRIWNAARSIPGLRAPRIPSHIQHAAYKCYVFVEPEALAGGWSRDRIIEAISARSIPCYQGTCSEVYLEKAFDDTGWRPRHPLPNANELGRTALMFLVHPTLQDHEIAQTCLALSEVMREATMTGMPHEQ